MPHGSRIALLAALALTGCTSVDKRTEPLKPLRPAVTPTGDSQNKAATPAKPVGATPTSTNAGRATPYNPVVSNDNFQRPIAESPAPQKGYTPPLGTPAIPGTSYPDPIPSRPNNEITPMAPPGNPTGLTTPPTAEGNVGDLKVPSLMGPK